MVNIKTWLLEQPVIYNLVTNVLSGSYDKLDTVVQTETAGDTDAVLLEIACGTGHFYSALLKGSKYYGLDINYDYVFSAQNKYQVSRFLCGDARCVPLRRESIDIVLFVGFFHHVDDDFSQQVVEEVRRVMKKNGRIIVVDAIWPTSRLNVIGGGLRFLDRGKHVRTYRGYKHLFDRIGVRCEKSYTFRYGISLECGVFILSNSFTGKR